MASRLKKIYDSLEEVLYLIDTAEGYNTTTGQIQQVDDVLAVSNNADDGYVNYYYRMRPDGIRPRGQGWATDAYYYTVPIEITAQPYLPGDDANPRTALQELLWEVHDDIRRAFGRAELDRSTAMSNEVESWEIVNVQERITERETLIEAGKLVVVVELYVSQSWNNITNKGC